MITRGVCRYLYCLLVVRLREGSAQRVGGGGAFGSVYAHRARRRGATHASCAVHGVPQRSTTLALPHGVATMDTAAAAGGHCRGGAAVALRGRAPGHRDGRGAQARRTPPRRASRRPLALGADWVAHTHGVGLGHGRMRHGRVPRRGVIHCSCAAPREGCACQCAHIIGSRKCKNTSGTTG